MDDVIEESNALADEMFELMERVRSEGEVGRPRPYTPEELERIREISSRQWEISKLLRG